MKQKKYIITLIIIITTIFIKVNPVYAGAKYLKTCYYMYTDPKDGTKTQYVLTLKSGYTGSSITSNVDDYAHLNIDYAGGVNESGDSEQVNNWFSASFTAKTTAANDIVYKEPGTVQFYYKSAGAANSLTQSQLNSACPSYIIFQKCTAYREWATESKSHAEAIVKAINKVSGCVGYYAAKGKSDANGNITSEYTAADYYGQNLTSDTDVGESKSDNIFGDSENSGSGCTEDGTCTTYPSIAYLLDEALDYIRIIVPLLLITLGSLDFAKAVVAGSEDKMKKARTAFVKRAAAALAVFFVPTIVDIIMELYETIKS